VSADLRIGFGYDVHAFAPGRRLVLGGVEIPHEVGLLGHSDADVVLHALGDALLGAASLGDLGDLFPPSDAQWKDADSLELLRQIMARVQARGWDVVNVDIAVLAEAPKLAPHRPLMRERIAAALGVDSDRVGIKATTNEGLGFVGRREGIAAMATVLLQRGGP
jgi:2-C-methyl-D-erythritol 2,4-cyclodiphosphate synthase